MKVFLLNKKKNTLQNHFFPAVPKFVFVFIQTKEEEGERLDFVIKMGSN